MNIVLKAKWFVTSRIKNLKVRKYLKASSKRGIKGKKAKIAFLAQMPEVWDKQCLVYERLKEMDDVETDLIVIPAYDFENDRVGVYGEEKKYFEDKYGTVIEGIDGKGQIISLKQYDYVFYQRPYDEYLPLELRSSEVVKYAKVCHIPYGYTGAKVFDGSALTGFYRNVYIAFMDSTEQNDALKKRFRTNVKKGYQHFCDFGYPVFEKFMDLPRREKLENILWTPRWSYKAGIGGSHFMEYKDEIFSMNKKYDDINVVIRPHPLTFSNMIKEGRMTEAEVTDYKKRLEDEGVRIDSNKMIEDTLFETDILISDYSAILIMYFLTGRPLIFCRSEFNFNTMYKKMLEGVYIADSWSDVEKYVECIKSGNDYLKEKRRQIIATEFSDIKGSTERIVEYLLQDSNKYS